MNSIMVAQALAKFQKHLSDNMGEPISLVTIREFAVMVKGVIDALGVVEDGD